MIHSGRGGTVDLTDKLLSLAAASAWDGGDGVVRVLGGILAEAAPFDAAEVAVSRPIGFDRWTLTDDDGPVAAEDLLLHVAGRREPLRLDDVHQAEAFPRTREMFLRRGLRSLLALPLAAAGGTVGVVVLARQHGWAFVAASLHTLEPAVAMAGLCLERAFALTALRREVESLRHEEGAAARRLEELMAGAEEVRQVWLAEARAAAEASTARIDGLEQKLGEVESAREAQLAEGERLRAEAARLDAERRALVEERESLKSTIEELRARAREAKSGERQGHRRRHPAPREEPKP